MTGVSVPAGLEPLSPVVGLLGSAAATRNTGTAELPAPPSAFAWRDFSHCIFSSVKSKARQC